MKFQCFFAVSLMVLTFFSCVKDEVIDNPEHYTGSVRVQIVQSNSSETRAEGPAIGAAQITLSEGHMYFASLTSVTRHIKIENGNEGDSDLDNNMVTTGDLIKGISIENVPEKSEQIIIISNLPETIVLPQAVGTAISEINSFKIKVQEMGDDNGTVDNVPLYGAGDIDKYQEVATINIYAIASRIEIAGIKSKGNVTAYTVAGIFIDNYYTQMELGGKMNNADLIDNGSLGYKFVGNTGTYATDTYMHDYYTPALVPISKLVTPTKEVWAYNVFPGNHPRVIIRLEDCEAYNEQSGIIEQLGTRFLTIASIRTEDGEVDKFIKRTVYHINEVLFDESNWTEQPNRDGLDVDATLKLNSWIYKDATVVW